MKLQCCWGEINPLIVFWSSGMWRCNVGFWFFIFKDFLYSLRSRKARVGRVTEQGGRDEGKKEEMRKVKNKGKRLGKNGRNRYEEKDKREDIKTEKAKKKVILLLHLHDCHIRITSRHENAGPLCCGIKKRFHLIRPRRRLVHHILIFCALMLSVRKRLAACSTIRFRIQGRASDFLYGSSSFICKESLRNSSQD
jgi:hypothetical protein